MATFFGEVMPSFSRAVDDEEDEVDNPEIASTSVRWSPTVRAELLRIPDKKLPCQAMIVAIGPAAAGFAQAYLLTKDFTVVGALFSGMNDDDVNTFEQMSPSDKTCYVYRSRSIPDVFLCLCKTDVDAEQAYSWTDQLFSCISCVSPHFYMCILCTYMTSEYRSEVPVSEMELPFLRALKTSRFPGTPPCPYLEQPNLVSGLPAQLLTYCQMQDVKSVLYICYTDSIYLDYQTMSMFKPLVETTPIKDIIEENEKADEVMKSIVDMYSMKNTLYL